MYLKFFQVIAHTVQAFVTGAIVIFTDRHDFKQFQLNGKADLPGGGKKIYTFKIQTHFQTQWLTEIQQ